MSSDSQYTTLFNHISGVLDGSIDVFDSYLARHCLPGLAGIKKEDGQKLADACYKALLSQTDEDNIVGIANLLSEVLQFFTYEDILKFEPPVDLVGGLMVPLEPFRLLVLTVLEIAAKSPVHARQVATDSPEVLRELIKFWLITESSRQAETAARVLTRMLRSDSDVRGSGIDDGIARISISSSLPSGPVWNEIFANEDTFSEIVKGCRADPDGGRPTRADASIARGRLLDWLPEVAQMSWFAVSKNPVETPTVPILKNFQGLIQFGMQDLASLEDPLSTLVAITSLVGLLRIRGEGNPESETSLGLIKSLGIHDRLVDLYMVNHPSESTEARLVAPAAAEYVSNFLRQYPDLFVGSNVGPEGPEFVSDVLDIMSRDFNIPLGHWALLSNASQASSNLPKLILHLDILQSLPRSTLINKPVPGYPPRAVSPLLKLPMGSGSSEVIVTLGNIFHGPTAAIPPEILSVQAGKPSRFVDFQTEATASRDLYAAYIIRHPGTWASVIEHANASLSNKDVVFGAIRFIRQIVTANWGEVENGPENLDSPLSGSLAILAPRTFQVVMPYLLNPKPSNAQTIAGSGRLRLDDADHHSLHRLVTERFDILRLLRRELINDAKRFAGVKGVNGSVVARIPSVLKEIEGNIEKGPWSAVKDKEPEFSVATKSG